MKTYSGIRGRTGLCHISVWGGKSRKLPARRDLFNHSPDGFEWGYEGSGPAQLALALLADALEDDELAIALHQQFKRARIARLDRDARWQMTEQDIRNWVALQPKLYVVDDDDRPWPPDVA
jgi:hypothetical protein